MICHFIITHSLVFGPAYHNRAVLACLVLRIIVLCWRVWSCVWSCYVSLSSLIDCPWNDEEQFEFPFLEGFAEVGCHFGWRKLAGWILNLTQNAIDKCQNGYDQKKFHHCQIVFDGKRKLAMLFFDEDIHLNCSNLNCFGSISGRNHAQNHQWSFII